MTSAVTQAVTQFARPTYRLDCQQKAGARSRERTSEDFLTAMQECSRFRVCAFCSKVHVQPASDEVSPSCQIIAAAAASLVERSAGRLAGFYQSL